MSSRPLEWVAYSLWAGSLPALLGALLWYRRAGFDADGNRKVVMPVALLTLGLFAIVLGIGCYLARPGELAATASLADLPVSKELTGTLSPIPTAPPAPDTATSSGERSQSVLVDIGFEEIGSVTIGGPPSKIESAFGKPAAVVETVSEEGTPVEAYLYEGKRNFTIFVSDSRVRSYRVLSAEFVTFSGIAVGDSYEKVESVYGAKLVHESEGILKLQGPRSTSLRFYFEDRKVVRIEGGLIN